MNVRVDVEEGDVEDEDGWLHTGVRITCSRCGFSIDVRGTTDKSIRYGCWQLKERCPQGERNFYTDSLEATAVGGGVLYMRVKDIERVNAPLEVGNEWSSDQIAAQEKILRWLSETPGGGVFRVFGYAGTGKTTLIKWLVAKFGAVVRVAAYTGKAADVLCRKGVRAMTIHRMIYLVVEESRVELAEIVWRLETEPDMPSLEREQLNIRRDYLEKFLERPHFVLNNKAFDNTPVRLIVIDEVSMIDQKLARDLLSFGINILVFGDPMQLQPWGKDEETGEDAYPYFMNDDPDVMLQQIHRQAEGSQIIQASMKLRKGERLLASPLKKNVVPEFVVADRGNFLAVLDNCWWHEGVFEQIIVGSNLERFRFNVRVRRRRNIKSAVPVAGERVICLHNNNAHGLRNGSQWMVKSVDEYPAKPEHIDLHLVSLDGNVEIGCKVWRDLFLMDEKRFKEKMKGKNLREVEQFDFAYAITCNKAQGSEWKSVMVVDESRKWKERWMNWLYTAVTRASERVLVVRGIDG